MIALLLAEALRSRRGILRVGNVPHASQILGALAAVVNVPPCPGKGREAERNRAPFINTERTIENPRPDNLERLT